MTAAKCAAHCSDYEFFGVEYGRECWCGEHPPQQPAPEFECSFPCAGDRKTACGAGRRSNVWGPALMAPPVVGDYLYRGCYKLTTLLLRPPLFSHLCSPTQRPQPTKMKASPQPPIVQLKLQEKLIIILRIRPSD